MKQNDIAEAIAFYNRKPETLVRHIIPVVDCNLVVYHRPGKPHYFLSWSLWP